MKSFACKGEIGTLRKGLHQVTCVHNKEMSGLAPYEQKDVCNITTIKRDLILYSSGNFFSLFVSKVKSVISALLVATDRKKAIVSKHTEAMY